MQGSRHLSQRGDWLVVEISGDLDLATAPALRQELLAQLSAGSRKIVIDLTDTEFIDSVGLGLLVAVLKRVRVLDGELAVVCPEPRLRRLFTITDLDRVFVLYDTADAAINAAG
jgi:anti-sigma B factor antagonist